MGNSCKSSGKLEHNFEPFVERISYKTADSKKHNNTEHLQNAVRSEENPLSTSYNMVATEECPSPLLMPMPEFIKICTSNRPAGISDNEWYRFVSTISFECFWIDVQGEVDKKVRVNTPMLGSSTSDLVSNSIEQDSGRSTHSKDDSSLEFAGHFVFTNIDGYQSDAESTSQWSLTKQSRSSPCEKYYTEICNDDEIRSNYDKELKLSTFRLGDIELNASEDNSSYDENKISRDATSSINPELSVAGKVQINVWQLKNEDEPKNF